MVLLGLMSVGFSMAASYYANGPSSAARARRRRSHSRCASANAVHSSGGIAS
jgi:hypothetical protein